MKAVSRAYKNSMAGLLRDNSYAIVRFDNVDTEAAGDGEWTGNGSMPWSDWDTVNYRYDYPETEATLEWNRWLLDGSQVILSDETRDGFVSDKMSMGTGEYQDGGETTIHRQFENVHSFPGITMTFDTRADEWPTSLTAVFALDGETVATFDRAVTGNPFAFETNVEEADEITITFHSALPYRRIRIQYIMFGVSREFTNNELVSTVQRNDVDPLSRRLPSEKFSFTILDYDHKYDPDNPDGIYRFVEINSPVSIQYGYTLPDGRIEWLKADNYLLDAQPTVEHNQATFSATGLIGSLTDIYYKSELGEKDFYSMAEDVLLDANLTLTPEGKHPWVIDESLREMYTTAVLPIDTHMNCLQLIAHACRCVLYTDDDNIIHIEPFGVTVTGIFSGEFSDNGHTDYSEWQSVNTGNSIGETYATLEWNRWELGTDSKQIIASEPYAPTGYVSSHISDADGSFYSGGLGDRFTVDENGHLIYMPGGEDKFYLDSNGHLIYTGDENAQLYIGEDGHLYQDGLTADAPTFTRTFDVRKDLPIVGLQFDKVLDEHPREIEIRYYRDTALLDTQIAAVDETDTVILSDLVRDCDKIEVTCKRTLPYYRFRVSKVYYRQTDFSLNFDNIHIDTQRISKIDKLKNVQVSKTIYTANTNAQYSVSGDLFIATPYKVYEAVTDEESLHIEFGQIVENMNISLSDGTVEYVAAYGRAVDLEVSPGLKTITITGNIITESTAVRTYTVSYTGETDIEDNPLITTDDMRDELAEHVAAYLQMRNTYDVEYRGNPELETRDVIGYQTAYTDEFYALVLVDEIMFNGALHGNVKVKGLITEAETVIRITAVVRPAGGGTASGSGRYEKGDLVTLVAEPADGFTFSNWQENGKNLGSNPVLEFVAVESRRIVAVFVGVQNYTITLVSLPEGAGTLTGGGTYSSDEPVTVTAVPLAGYTFRGWAEDGVLVSDNSNYTFTVNRDRTLTAMFLEMYTVTVAASPAGFGTVSGGGLFEAGETATVAAVAGSDYRFVAWTVDGNTVSTSTRYSFTVTGNVALVAVFEEKPKKILYDKTSYMSVGRARFAGAANTQYAVFAGGRIQGNTGYITTTATVEAYSSAMVRTIAADMGSAKYDLAGASNGTYAVFAGGWKGSLGSGTTIVYAYNTNLTRHYVGQTNLTYRLYNMAGAGIGEYAIFAGGSGGSSTSTEHIYSEVYAYNQNLVMSKPTKFLITNSFRLSGASNDNYAVFAGGSNGSSWQRYVVGYDKDLNRKSERAYLQTARGLMAGAGNGKFVVFAGGAAGSAGTASNSADAYDGELTKRDVDNLGLARYRLAGTRIGTYAMFTGGYNGSEAYSTSEAYDANLTHIDVQSMTTVRYNHAAAGIGEKALFAGGNSDNSTYLSSIDVYKLE